MSLDSSRASPYLLSPSFFVVSMNVRYAINASSGDLSFKRVETVVYCLALAINYFFRSDWIAFCGFNNLRLDSYLAALIIHPK